ncbi:MAG: HPr(Ser) kinase/phosphatase [Defluviitaleaceae bacterium]|nr:HPr(Ser) kinase/phosphatase [Defluviitaleaceae bacterium]
MINKLINTELKPKPVSLQKLVEQFELTSLTPSITIESIYLDNPSINKPGIQFTGFYDFFVRGNIQIIGKVEHEYLKTLQEKQRDQVFSEFFHQGVPCVILTKDLSPMPELLIHAEISNTPIYTTSLPSSDFIPELLRWLRIELAPKVTLHGVLIDIFGEGVMIMGDSGIGKSETALELIKRGHRLIADDAIDIKRISSNTLIGQCPSLIQNFMEVRGIGIIDVQKMFGVEALKTSQVIDLILNLEYYKDDDSYKNQDRIGEKEEFTNILGNNIVTHNIQLKDWRNLAVICETAAVNHRQKKMGYSASQELKRRLKEALGNKS